MCSQEKVPAENSLKLVPSTCTNRKNVIMAIGNTKQNDFVFNTKGTKGYPVLVVQTNKPRRIHQRSIYYNLGHDYTELINAI
jgi:hypothetical protein